ncbi:MAG: hypothetical protein ABSD74_16470 [Rhizomicrobium sp.]|jgi:hypothetical protein
MPYREYRVTQADGPNPLRFDIVPPDPVRPKAWYPHTLIDAHGYVQVPSEQESRCGAARGGPVGNDTGACSHHFMGCAAIAIGQATVQGDRFESYYFQHSYSCIDGFEQRIRESITAPQRAWMVVASDTNPRLLADDVRDVWPANATIPENSVLLYVTFDDPVMGRDLRTFGMTFADMTFGQFPS